MSKFIEIKYIHIREDGITLVKCGNSDGFLIDSIYLNINYIVSIDIGCHSEMFHIPHGLFSTGEYDAKSICGFFITDINNKKYFIQEKYYNSLKNIIFNNSNSSDNKEVNYIA